MNANKNEITQVMYNGLKVLSCYHRKGGVGKSLFTATIAYLLATGGPNKKGNKKKVLILDYDSQQDTSKTYLGMELLPGADQYIAPLLNPDDWQQIEGHTGRNYSTDILFNLDTLEYETAVENISILPSEGSVDRLAGIPGTASEIVSYVRKHISDWFNMPELAEDFDVVLIDNPPSKTHMATGLLEAATHTIIPTDLGIEGIDGVPNLLNLISKINETRATNPLNVIGIVPNKVPRSLKRKDKLALEELYNPESPTSKFMADFFLQHRECYRPEKKPTTSEVDFNYINDYYAKEEMFKLYELIMKELFNEKVIIPADNYKRKS